MRLRCILDEIQPVTCRDIAHRREVRRLPIEMHGHQRLRARGDRRFDQCGIEIRGRRLDVHEHRGRACLLDGEHRERGGHR